MQGIFGDYLPTSTLFESPLPENESQLTLALGIVGATVRPIISIFIHSYPKQGKSTISVKRMFENLFVL